MRSKLHSSLLRILYEQSYLVKIVFGIIDTSDGCNPGDFVIQTIKNERFTVLLDSIPVVLILGFKDVVIIKFDFFFFIICQAVVMA